MPPCNILPSRCLKWRLRFSPEHIHTQGVLQLPTVPQKGLQSVWFKTCGWPKLCGAKYYGGSQQGFRIRSLDLPVNMASTTISSVKLG